MSLATIHADLRIAFRERLLTLSDPDFAANRVAWEGQRFNPSAATPYFSESFRPGPSRRYGVGAGLVLHHPIEATVSLFFPHGEDTAAIERCAGAVMTLFQPPTTLSRSGASAIIRQVERSPLYLDGERIACAVTADMIAYTAD